MAKKDACRRLLVAVGLVVAALVYGGCASRDPVDDAVDPDGSLVSEEGRIAFTHAAKLNWSDVPSSESEVHAIDVDGSGERRLTDSPGLDGFPACSPDDERVAFASYAGNANEEIYVMNADGSGRIRLTNLPGADHWPPTWSPDGTRIAFTSDGTEGRGEIYVMNADGSGLTKLTDDPAAEDFYPAWRP